MQEIGYWEFYIGYSALKIKNKSRIGVYILTFISVGDSRNHDGFVTEPSILSGNKKIPRRSGSHHREMRPTNIKMQISNAKCTKPKRNANSRCGMQQNLGEMQFPIAECNRTP